jgi:LPXTG-motif cell wall-anchored protein
MKLNYLFLGLLVLTAVVGLWATGDPERAGRLAQAQRDAALTGETRQIALTLLAVAIGGFIAYMALKRR